MAHVGKRRIVAPELESLGVPNGKKMEGWVNLARSWSDDAAALEQPRAPSFGQLAIADDSPAPLSRSGKSLGRNADVETANLSPSLIPAPQPTISLISTNSSDSLGIESLTLVPPVDTDCILAVGCAPLPAAESDASTEAEGSVSSHSDDG
ncbi:UNVERIFIED_CONTAM: hypothetical protein K2H54_017899 [Gekko kuhli]